ncbi:MAG: sigma 54-interacting transcriptional regulator [Peptostreptococcaceae bacterium]|nr:sigma 54-interacting transcriptional regulator [Peptostreptococcaceae bacterium]
MNSHFTFSSALDRQRALLKETRHRFLCNSQDTITVRSIVHASWVRCLQSGIDPRRKQADDPLKNADIEAIIGRSVLYEHSIATLSELSIQTKETKVILTLSDSQGRIIFLGGDHHVQQQAENMNFLLGSNWSEEVIGTNGIGLSLKTGYPVQIFTAEHFCEGIHDWVCSSSPVRDPLTKEVLGVINVTGPWKGAQVHTLGMAVMASKVIEQKLHEQSLLTRNITKAHHTLSLKKDPWSEIVGRSSTMLSAMTQCNMVAQANVPVLLFGESGSGKDLFAHAIHQINDRRNGPFIALNCGSIPKELIASELFGYDPGSFTGAAKGGKKGKFEEAHGGTLFFDEIGEMSLEFQVHLLRVVQEREVMRIGGSKPIPVDVRIITATHETLEELVSNGLFRDDLYYRLNVVSITIPPLRERQDDIQLLIDYFLEQFAYKHGKPLLKLEPLVKELLIHDYKWPGNVRELQNCLEHAVLFCTNDTIMKADLPQSLQKLVMYKSDWSRSKVSDVNPFASYYEKEALLSLLQEYGGNLSAVARQLGVARTTIYRHLEKCDISAKL